MRQTQARNAPSPRNSAICSNAARKASCAASSALAPSAPIRRSRPRTAAPWRRTSSPNAARSPAAPNATSSRSWALASGARLTVGAMAMAEPISRRSPELKLRLWRRLAPGQVEKQVGQPDKGRNGPGPGDDAASDGPADPAGDADAGPQQQPQRPESK